MALAGASRPALPGVRGKKPRRPGSAGVGENGVRAGPSPKVTSKSEMGKCQGNASCGCKEASTGQKKLRFLLEQKGLETSSLVDEFRLP
ncbi:hypothetical protein NDU88_005379 [Pleurodeles waltl]|uniref:Uncharacterized protein n=1 Tax=Pleurodeles waltl TaxID=8319 RepID=A0AAV7V3Z4_PLEWA|nr:hypothetical protein NDU88_005379 [Pleurodeles waltl]